MARTKEYGQFCPVANSLEVIGEKWSLLIVRDLLVGPQRFTDLLSSLKSITPKLLTLRLRDLEAASVVERDQVPGRRVVWYRLTLKGVQLAPAVDALAVWGVQYALPSALPEALSIPTRTLPALVGYLNRRGVTLPQPVMWLVQVSGQPERVIHFDGTHWSTTQESGSDDPDAESFEVVVQTTPDVWSDYLMATVDVRTVLLQAMKVTGQPDRVDDFTRVFGWRLPHTRGVVSDLQSATRR